MLKKLFSFTRNKDASSTTSAVKPVDNLNESVPKQRQQLLSRLRQCDDSEQLSEIGSKLVDNSQLINDFIASPHPMIARLAASRMTTQSLTSEQITSLIQLPHSLAFQQLFIDQCNDQDQLFILASNGHSSEIRQQATARINKPETLKKILDAVGNRDKKVRQQIKEILNALKQQEKEQQQLEQQADDLVKQAQHLASSHWGPQHSGKLQVLKQHGAALATDLSSQQQQHFNEAVAQLEAVLKTQQDQAAAELLAQQKQTQLAQLVADVEATVKQLGKDYLPALGQQFDTIIDSIAGHNNDRLTALSQQLMAIKQAYSQFQLLEPQLQQSHDKGLPAEAEILASINWPGFAKPPALLAALSTAKPELKKSPVTIDKEQLQQLCDKLEALLDQCELAVDNKDLTLANQLSNKIRQQFKNNDAVNTKALNNYWHRLNKRVYELRDWQKFASTPKRQELCQAMAKLVNDNGDLQSRSDSIKQLQEQWKQLGSDYSAEANELWSQFKEAADAAYAPCKTYFANAQQQRVENAEKRQQLCQQLEQYLSQNDWQQSTYQQIDSIQQQAKQEWHSLHPVEKKRHKPLQNQFNKLIKALNNHRQANLDIIIEGKRALINQAKELLQSDDLNGAINQAKEIQRNWQKLAVLPHAIDKKLWHELREQLDPLFDKRQLHKNERDLKQQLHADQAKLIIEQLQQLAELDDQALKDSREQFDQLVEQYRNTGGRPNQAFKSQQQLFQQACDDYQQSLKGIGSRQQQQQWQQFIDFVALLNKRDRGDTDSQDLIDQQWQQLTLDNDWRLAVGQRISEAASPQADEQYQHLCIELELLLNIASPETDQALRLTLQMEKLTQGLGQQGRSKQQLILQWFSWPACANLSLQQRFDAMVAQ
ncbi:hypothetical protein SIN8267_03575 [Sinobacterium norvegicum]|uniref:DUF349 domain-containing protein n=1 Tax=Sinobacterium norvegicum TaxID=1641715 RepID=A0ABN8ELY8_9GAMM|nr:DUF349 domain-containing protein [Sinobacterium norvegicum]CAH0993426.1 hypothetical protein SIN8267_03575 [Sinobacterium norvegicum]